MQVKKNGEVIRMVCHIKSLVSDFDISNEQRSLSENHVISDSLLANVKKCGIIYTSKIIISD